jgi:hypothetical protein
MHTPHNTHTHILSLSLPRERDGPLAHIPEWNVVYRLPPRGGEPWGTSTQNTHTDNSPRSRVGH